MKQTKMNNHRLGIGFIGGGFISRFHIQSLLSVRDCDVVGVMSRTREAAETSAACRPVHSARLLWRTPRIST